MSRRSDHTRDELTALALQAGLHILDQDGLAALTARRIMAEIGYSVGTLYHLFGSLDGYILRLNGLILKDWLSRLAPAATSIEQLANAYLAEAESHPARFACLYRSAWHQSEPMPSDVLEPLLAELFALIDVALSHSTSLPAARRKKLGRMIWIAVHGIASLSLDQKLWLLDDSTPQQQVDLLLKSLLRDAV